MPQDKKKGLIPLIVLAIIGVMFAVTSIAVVSRSQIGDIRNRAASSSVDPYPSCQTECQIISGKKCHWDGASWDLGMYCTESAAGETPTIIKLAPGSNCIQGAPFGDSYSCLHCPYGDEPNGSGGYRCKAAACTVSYGDVCMAGGDAQGSADSCVSCCPEGFTTEGDVSRCYEEGEEPASGLSLGAPCYPGGDAISDPDYCGNCPGGTYYTDTSSSKGGRCGASAKPSSCPTSGYCTPSGSCPAGYSYISYAAGCSGINGCCPSAVAPSGPPTITTTTTPTQTEYKPFSCPTSGYCTSSSSCRTGYQYSARSPGCTANSINGCCPSTVAPSGPPTTTTATTPTQTVSKPSSCPTSGYCTPSGSCPAGYTYISYAGGCSGINGCCPSGTGTQTPTQTVTPTPTITRLQQCQQQCQGQSSFVAQAICLLSCLAGGATPTVAPTPTETPGTMVTCQTWIGGQTVSPGYCEYRPPGSGVLQMCRQDIGGWGAVTGTCTNTITTPTAPTSTSTPQNPPLTCSGGEPVGTCQIRRVMQKCTVLPGWTFALWADPSKSPPGCPNGTTCSEGGRVYQTGDCHFFDGSTKICRGSSAQFTSGSWVEPEERECNEEASFGEYVQGVSTVSRTEIIKTILSSAIQRSFPFLMLLERLIH